MNISKLIFFPKPTDADINTQTLLNTLIESQFITAKELKTNHYLPGERFLNLITFLGCSPKINLFPVDGESHCFISFIEPTGLPSCVGYTKTAYPKCPSCTKRIVNWKIPDWKLPGKLCKCDKCQTITPYTELNWKHECGFARYGFLITQIYPYEAVPTDQFLHILNQFSDLEWSYCYANN